MAGSEKAPSPLTVDLLFKLDKGNKTLDRKGWAQVATGLNTKSHSPEKPGLVMLGI